MRGAGGRFEGGGKFLDEEIRRRQAVSTPPNVDSPDLVFDAFRDDNPEAHRRFLRSLMTSAAGRTFPAFASDHEAAIAACKALRSRASKSSPSSSTTRS